MRSSGQKVQTVLIWSWSFVLIFASWLAFSPGFFALSPLPRFSGSFRISRCFRLGLPCNSGVPSPRNGLSLFSSSKNFRSLLLRRPSDPPKRVFNQYELSTIRHGEKYGSFFAFSSFAFLRFGASIFVKVNVGLFALSRMLVEFGVWARPLAIIFPLLNWNDS